MKLNFSKFFVFVLISLLLTGCYLHGPEFASDTDVVYTNHNPDFAFKSKGTFAIPDKIVKITGPIISGEGPKYLSDAVAKPMLDQMIKNMQALGYTKVDISASPSLILAPSAMESTTIVYWYDYWGWYWGGYYPGWGYPYYPSYTTYSTGTLIMTIIDPLTVSADGNPIAQWNSALNGLLTYSFDAARVNRLIDQAFIQSPYLKK